MVVLAIVSVGIGGSKASFTTGSFFSEGNFEILTHCFEFAEQFISESDNDSRAKMSRQFLTEAGVFSCETANTIIRNVTCVNHPACIEAFELAFPVLKQIEAANLAKTLPTIFYGLSPNLLEAIKDYSKFSREHLEEAHNSVSVAGLVNIKSAVLTLPSESLIYLLDLNDFEIPPQTEDLVKKRWEHLSHAAVYNPQLLYQFLLVRGSIEIDDSVALLVQPSKNDNSDSPAFNLAFGNFINSKGIIEMASVLSEPKWKQLAFSYAIYTGVLMEQVFASIVYRYQYLARTGLTVVDFIAFHRVAIDDLKLILSERVKLLDVCKDEKLKLLLSVPLSRQVRDSLAGVDSSTIFNIVINFPTHPAALQQWLWAYAIQSFYSSDENRKRPFPFQVKSTREILDAFVEVFGDRPNRRFLGGHIGSVFISHLLFGENDLKDVQHLLVSLYQNHAANYRPDFGMLPEKLTELAGKNKQKDHVYSLAYGIVTARAELKTSKKYNDYFKLFRRLRIFEHSIQYHVASSDICLDLIKEAFADCADTNALRCVLANYPEALGITH